MDEVPDYITLIREYFRDGTRSVVPKGHPVVTRADPVRQVYYIGSGYVRVYSQNDRGEQYTHIIYGPGDVFPLTSLGKNDATTAIYEYQALTEAEIYSQLVDTIKKDLITARGLGYGLMQQVIQQYRVYAMRVDNLEYKYASERLAYRLILLGNRFGERSGESVTILPPMTHQLLGSSLNLSRESVSREIEKLKRKGLIRYNAQRQIIVTDMHQLSEQMHVPLQQGLA